jgi:hypothetical protein
MDYSIPFENTIEEILVSFFYDLFIDVCVPHQAEIVNGIRICTPYFRFTFNLFDAVVGNKFHGIKTPLPYRYHACKDSSIQYDGPRFLAQIGFMRNKIDGGRIIGDKRILAQYQRNRQGKNEGRDIN